MGEYELWVNMNYEWIWIMGEYELWVNFGVDSPQGGEEEEEEDKLGF